MSARETAPKNPIVVEAIRALLLAGLRRLPLIHLALQDQHYWASDRDVQEIADDMGIQLIGEPKASARPPSRYESRGRPLRAPGRRGPDQGDRLQRPTRRDEVIALRFEHPKWTLEEIGDELGLTKQAVHKHLQGVVIPKNTNKGSDGKG